MKIILNTALALSLTSPVFAADQNDSEITSDFARKVISKALKQTVVNPVASTLAEPFGRGLGAVAEGLGEVLMNPTLTAAPGGGVLGAALGATVGTSGVLLKAGAMALQGDNPLSALARQGAVHFFLNGGANIALQQVIPRPRGIASQSQSLTDAALNNVMCNPAIGLVEGKALGSALGMVASGSFMSAVAAVPLAIGTVGAAKQLRQDLPSIVKDTAGGISETISNAADNIKSYQDDFAQSENADDIDIFSNPDAAAAAVGEAFEAGKAAVLTTGYLFSGTCQTAKSATVGAWNHLCAVTSWGSHKFYSLIQHSNY